MLTPMLQSVPNAVSRASVVTPATTAHTILNQYSLSNAAAGRAFVAELSGFEVLVLAKEIDSALRGTYVNNIYTAGTSQLLRLRRPGGEDLWLVVSPRKGIWTSARVAEREETSDFTTRVRSELQRARFVGADQLDLDRIFRLFFEGDDRKTLILELMPPGNLLILDREGRIRVALNEVRAKGRRLVKGGTYLPPGQSRTSPADVGPADVGRMLREEDTVGKAIGKHVALPRKYVADALGRLGAGDGTPSRAMEGREDEIAGILRSMAERARSSPAPCICETEGGEEVFAFHPGGLKVKEEAPTMSELCDRLFLDEATTPSPAVSPEEARRKELQATASKLRSDSESLLGQAARAREGADRARDAPLDEALQVVRSLGSKPAREPTSSQGQLRPFTTWRRSSSPGRRRASRPR